MGLDWQHNVSSQGVSPEMNDRMNLVRDRLLALESQQTPVPIVAEDGSTDESMDRDILVDATPIPVPVSGPCCEGGKCQPKPETRVYKAACEDSSPTYRQTTHFERLDSLPMRPGLICEQAAKIVAGARQGAYGKPEQNLDRVAILWEAYDCAVATMPEGHVPLAVQVADKMILVKMARTIETPNHTDSWRDKAGYADCGAVVAGCDPSK